MVLLYEDPGATACPLLTLSPPLLCTLLLIAIVLTGACLCACLCDCVFSATDFEEFLALTDMEEMPTEGGKVMLVPNLAEGVPPM